MYFNFIINFWYSPKADARQGGFLKSKSIECVWSVKEDIGNPRRVVYVASTSQLNISQYYDCIAYIVPTCTLRGQLCMHVQCT